MEDISMNTADTKPTAQETLLRQFQEQQDKFTAWLVKQTPEVILDNAYSYTVRQDILMTVEYGEFTDKQVAALLRGKVTLDDVEKKFKKLDISHISDMHDLVESAANEILRDEFVQRTMPVYLHSAQYARQRNELGQFQASVKANDECAAAIKTAIYDCYADNRLDSKAALDTVLERFGSGRVAYVLASTIREADWDRRYSSQNKFWAATVPMADDLDERGKLRHPARVAAHPGLVDLFATSFRNSMKMRELGALGTTEPQVTAPQKKNGDAR